MAKIMQQRVAMALIGALAAASLYFLGEILDRELLGQRASVALVVFTATFFSALLTTAGPLSIPRAAIGAACLAAALAGLVSLAGLRYPRVEGLAEQPANGVMGLVLALLPLPFLIAAAAGPGWRHYPTLFTQAWSIFVRTSLAWIFVGLVWGVILLSTTLFGLVGLTLIDDLLNIPIMPWLITGLTLGLALAVVTELSDYVSPFLILRLLRLMLPPVLLVLAVFLLALPLRGLSGLFGGLSAAATLLAMVAAGATLVTSAVDQGDAEATQSALMRRATQALSLILPLPAGLAAWAIWLRVDQYGWTPSRIFAALVALIALGYGLSYALAVLRGAGWMERIRRANVAMALGVIGLAALWLTPVLNADRISAQSQYARFINSGDAAVLDLWQLRQWGKAGADVIAMLEKTATEPGQEALAAKLAESDAAPDQPSPDAAALRATLTAGMPVQPGSATATRDAILGLADSSDLAYWADRCTDPLPQGGPGCVLVVADFLIGLPGEEALLILRQSDGYISYDGLVMADGLLQHRAVISPFGDLPDYASGAAMIRELQKAPPALLAAPVNQIQSGGINLMLQP
jgi:hypothetical protein